MNSIYLFLWLFGSIAYFTTGIDAIIGGKETELKPFRYMVSLLEVEHGHICGGAIIGDQHVLSAAHCFLNPDNSFKNKRILALLGTNDLLKFDKPAINLEVVKVFVPKDYNITDENTTGDIAVLKLKERLYIVNHKNLKQAKLERSQKDFHNGQKATIAGWGWNKFVYQNNQQAGLRTDSLLRYVTADVYNYHQCQWEHPHLKIVDEHLCAKTVQHEYDIHGVCNGDDGGPLVYDGFVIGVLSKLATGCTERTTTALYTRVSHYLTFITNAKNDYVSKHMRQHVLRP